MFLSIDVLERAVQTLRNIAQTSEVLSQNKRGQERVSGISQLFAFCELMESQKAKTISLKLGSPQRKEIVDAVGRVVRLDDQGNYTPDFVKIKNDPSYKIGNNFLTSTLRDTRGRQKVGIPGRPVPLLIFSDEIGELHPNYIDNLKRFEFEAIRFALAVWLCRFFEFNTGDTTADIVMKMSSHLSQIYGSVISATFDISDVNFNDLTNGLPNILNSDLPTLSTLFASGPAASMYPLPTDDQTMPMKAVLGQNIIVYGAPGTGKSFSVDSHVGKINVYRTVFHPDTQNSDFFGSLKPTMEGQEVVYRFSPGALAKALCAASSDPEHQHFLVIEELNRAPAAAVFGELFQLLDRDEHGRGTYEVEFPNHESEKWFSRSGFSHNKMVMPPNLTIYATMNSADQGVYPLDTAFRRRWEQQYVSLYEGGGPAGKLSVKWPSSDLEMPWRTFVEALNNWLVDKYVIAEDRPLGVWFVKKSELDGEVPSKVLLYLWDDLLRHENRSLLFHEDIKAYGKLHERIDNGDQIFCSDFLDFLEATVTHGTPTPPITL